MNEFQKKVRNYLLEGGAERKSALSEMMDSGFFDKTVNADEVMFGRWIESWRKNGKFCESGLKRAEQALIPTKTTTVTVTLELEVPHQTIDQYAPHASGVTARKIQKALVGLEVGGEKGWRKITDVTIKECKRIN